jgi:uncharacterized integral membrane protein
MITVVLVVIVIAGVVVFSIQNATPAAISFLFWHFEASLAIIVLLSFLIGMFVGIAVLSWIRIRRAARKKKDQEAKRSNSTRPL